MRPGNGRAPGLGGEGREEKQLADSAADSAANSAEDQQKKPEIDLGSWLALGKPSRDRRQKSHRMRRATR